jgi:hypothetical protein
VSFFPTPSYPPSQLGLLKKMTLLRIGSTRFGGTIPAQLFGATALRNLKIDRMFRDLRFADERHGLTGTLPSQIGDLKQLSFLDLSYNFLHGTVPLELWTLPKLQELRIIRSSFNGTLAKEVRHRLID